LGEGLSSLTSEETQAGGIIHHRMPIPLSAGPDHAEVVVHEFGGELPRRPKVDQVQLAAGLKDMKI